MNRTRMLGHIKNLVGAGYERGVASLTRRELQHVAVQGERAVREHCKQFLGSGNSRCAYVTR